MQSHHARKQQRYRSSPSASYIGAELCRRDCTYEYPKRVVQFDYCNAILLLVLDRVTHGFAGSYIT